MTLDHDARLRMLAGVVETQVVGYCVIDEDFVIRYANQALADQVGRTVEDVIGRPGLDLIHPDDLEMAALALTQRTSDDDDFGDVGVAIPVRAVHADGSPVILEMGVRDCRDHPDIAGLVVRTRSLRSQQHLDTALQLMARGAPARVILAWLVQALDGIIEDGFSLLAVRDPDGDWNIPTDTDPALTLLGDEAHDLWARARTSNRVEVANIDDLPPTIAEPARAAGFDTVWVLAVPQSDLDGCIVVWRRTRRLPLVGVESELHRIADVVGVSIERDRALRQLERAARHDQLTGLVNRTTFHELLAESTAGPPDQATVGVLYVDLDGFKPVNDAHGHAVGDQLLQAAAARLTRAVRAADTVARLGGDEFAVVCPEVTRPVELETIAERVVRAFDDPFHLGPVTVRVGASVGVALHHPEQASTVPPGDRLLAAADRAMYEAKRDAGRRWVRAS